MTPLPRFLAALITVLAIAGCRQPDAPTPTPRDDDPNRIEDLRSNLTNIARGDPEGPGDLADDLSIFVQNKPAAQPVVTELATRVGTAVSGTTLSPESAQQLAFQLWTTVAAWDLSGRQTTALQEEVEATLVSAGVPAERAAPVAAQVGEVQRSVNERPRRWYQLF